MNSRLVLCFHGIGAPPHCKDEVERQHWCPVPEFVAILDGIPRVSAETGTPIDITFDDGFASDFEVAAPLLQARGMTATFFVCAGLLGEPGRLSADQVRRLRDAGMSIGSHGWAHTNWRTMGDERALHQEVVQARDVLSQTLGGAPVDSVALPYGGYDRRVVHAATRTFSKVYTSDPGLASPHADLIPRETYLSHRWRADTLQRLASPRPVWKTLRQSLVNLYKRHRQPLVAA